LNGVVGIEGVGDPMFIIVISTSCYLHFVFDALTLASFYTIDLYWRRLSSCILPWVWGSVSLDVGRVGYVVGDVASRVCWSVCRCRMDLPGPTTSVGTRTDYSVGPWGYPACATRHLKAWSTRTTQE
jgi:hypothetical protein